MPRRRVLAIAGSDSSGGAGLEADQKVLAAHGCYAMSATTALTAQDTKGVHEVHSVPPLFVRRQIDACFSDIGVDVVKTGMLASAETIQVVAEALRAHREDEKLPLVVDPVMVATSGARLLPKEAVANLISLLLPLSTVLTPNIPEAHVLLAVSGRDQRPIRTVEDLEAIARSLRTLGPDYVLVKGGHSPFRRGDYAAAETSDERHLVVDVLVGPDDHVTRIETAYQSSRHTHGTGCSLASNCAAAIAANIAQGLDMHRAVKSACRYVEAAIRTAPGFGQGNGPLNHFHSLLMLPFAPGRFVEYVLDHADVAPVWSRFTRHPFVLGLGDGSLPLDSFKGYLVQDYLYLTHFARAHGLSAFKSTSRSEISTAASIIEHIERESKLHLEYCREFGLTKEEVETADEHIACTAYSRYILDIGQSTDWVGLQIAMAPCLLGYGDIAAHLHGDPRSKREDNPYWTWVNNYTADDYVQAVRKGSDMLEKFAVSQSPAKIEELIKIFVQATKLEISFWEMFPSSPSSLDG